MQHPGNRRASMESASLPCKSATQVDLRQQDRECGRSGLVNAHMVQKFLQMLCVSEGDKKVKAACLDYTRVRHTHETNYKQINKQANKKQTNNTQTNIHTTPHHTCTQEQRLSNMHTISYANSWLGPPGNRESIRVTDTWVRTLSHRCQHLQRISLRRCMLVWDSAQDSNPEGEVSAMSVCHVCLSCLSCLSCHVCLADLSFMSVCWHVWEIFFTCMQLFSCVYGDKFMCVCIYIMGT